MQKHYLFAALACVLLPLSQSFAGDQAGTAPDFDQIIVTGALTPITINQLGSATTVITRDEIERRQLRYVSDLLRSVPGFSVSQSGGVGTQTQVRVRGSEANHVLVLIDGVRANDPASGDEFRWEYLATGNIERIEIVRGPQSSLWGSDAVAAVVHVITDREHSTPTLEAYAEGGSESTLNTGLSGATGAESWSLNGGIERLRTDGINFSRSGDERDGSELTTASLAGRVQLGQAFEVKLGLRANDAYSQYDPVDFSTGLPADADVATDSSNYAARLSTTLSKAGSRVTHHLRAHYFASDHRNLSGGVEDLSTASNRTTLAYQSDIAFEDYRLALALEHERIRFEQRGAVIFGNPNQNQEMDVTSVIADFQALANDRLTWLLSARFDDNSAFADALNGRVSASYALSDVATLRAGVGTGQKNPTFIERYGYFPAQFVGNAGLKPERSISYDLGLDYEFPGGALVAQLSLFRQDLRDEINGFVFDPATFLATAENIDGNSHRSGAEFGVHWTVHDLLGLHATYTYTDATEPDFSGQQSRELRRPRHTGSLAADVHSADQRFAATLTADYGGSRSDIFYPPFPEPSAIVTLDNYWLLGLTARVQLTPVVSLFVKGSNLLDESYEEVFGYRTPGRAGYVGVRTQFGN